MVADLGEGLALARDVHRGDGLAVGLVDLEAGDFERCGSGEVADGCLFRFCGAAQAFEYPLENTAVFAAGRSREAVVFVAAEPVDEIDLGSGEFAGRKWG